MASQKSRRKSIIVLTIIVSIVTLMILLFTLAPTKRHGPDSASPAKLLLVSLDGFYYRYLEQFPNETKFLRRHFVEEGVHAEQGMRSVFATKTFAIHWTLATGLYEEEHGILGNDFYDPDFNQTFTARNANESKWFGGEPIWSVAQKQGRRVGVSQWLGSAVTFPDDRQSPQLLDLYTDMHNSSMIHDKLAIVEDFLFRKDADLVMMYFNEPDDSGHYKGAGSEAVRKAISVIDSAFEQFISRIADASVNIIILSGT